MPSDNRLQPHEHQHLPPPRPESSQHHPEPFVSDRKPDQGASPFQHSKLLSKSKIFQQQIAASMKRPRSDSEQEPKQV
jgi:hypothetical protein